MKGIHFGLQGLSLALLALACSRSNGSAPSASGAKPASTVEAPHAVADAAGKNHPSEITGVLSEEEFKRLHELRGDAAPAARGSMLVLSDGSQAYLTLPKGAKPPLPGVIVIHEWWGLNEHIKHYADRLAGEGYAALAVDLFGEVATTPERAMQLTKSVKEEAAQKTLLTAHRKLAEDERIKATRRASIGWCFGGKWSLKLALAAPDLDAAVVYYGHVPTDEKQLALLEVPVLAIFGERDASIPLETVRKFEAGLKTSKASHRVLTYDAEHAFANPSGGRYDARAADAAWQETRAFLAKYLRPARP